MFYASLLLSFLGGLILGVTIYHNLILAYGLALGILMVYTGLIFGIRSAIHDEK